MTQTYTQRKGLIAYQQMMERTREQYARDEAYRSAVEQEEKDQETKDARAEFVLIASVFIVWLPVICAIAKWVLPAIWRALA